MNRRSFTSVGVALLSMAALMTLLALMAWINADVPAPARAVPLLAVPTVTEVAPASAPNDLDTPIVVTGTGFTTSSLVLLGNTELDDVGWVSAARLTATVPWGLAPGVYTLTVFNPGEGSSNLPNAFTVTQGLGVWTTNGPYGGIIHQVLLHPVTPTTVYAVASSVGVFASYDAGAAWEIILRDDGPTRLAIDAGDPDVMYCGRGDLLRTTNAGVDWESSPIPFYFQHGCSQSYPATHPISPGVIYLGVGGCGGSIPAEPGEGGVCRSDDYGSTWAVMTVGLTDTNVTDVAFHPDDPDRILVTTRNGNLFLSTDGGQHWNWTARLASSVRWLYFNPFGAHEAWATIAPDPIPPAYLYKSTDPDLAVWTPITVTDSPEWSYPVSSLAFVSDTIWAAAGYGFTSTDGGASWSPTGWAGVSSGDEVAAFAIDPSEPNLIYAGHSQGGMFRSTDGGATWREMNEGLAGIVPHALAVPRDSPDTIYAWSWERGLLRSDNGGCSWLSLDTWRGGVPSPRMLAVDPFTPTRLYLGDTCFGEMCMRISEDAGDTWRQVTATLPITLSDGWSNLGVIAPHPTIRGRILVNVGIHSDSGGEWEASQIFLSDDHGEHWQTIVHPQAISVAGDIAYDAVDPNLVYLGTGGTGLWKSSDGGGTWQPVPIPGVLPPIGIESVVPHPDISRTVYIRLYSTAATPNPEAELYVSEDAGATWTQLDDVEQSGGLWFAPSRPGKPPYTLYTGSAVEGLYCSRDGGQNWEQVEGVSSPTALATGCDDERVVVYVGTRGGVVQIDLDDVLRGAGVYRWTSRLPTPWLYLPLAYKDHGYFSLRSK